MKTQRLGRLAFRSAAWLSLTVFISMLLAVAIQLRRPVALGFIHREHEVATRTLRTIHLTAHGGGVWFDWAYHRINAESAPRWERMMRDRPHWWQRFDAPGGYSADNTWLGFYGFAGSRGSRTAYFIVRLPYWFVAGAGAVLPALELRRLLRARRRGRRGHCVRCGYDLRESPERCPECGAVAGSGLVTGSR